MKYQCFEDLPVWNSAIKNALNKGNVEQSIRLMIRASISNLKSMCPHNLIGILPI